MREVHTSIRRYVLALDHKPKVLCFFCGRKITIDADDEASINVCRRCRIKHRREIKEFEDFG